MGASKETVLRRDSGILIWVLLATAAIVILRSAWIGDDAWISFRSVDNLVNGCGLTWNVVERVQSFTNPLWVLLVAFAHLITGEIYYTVVTLSLLTTLGTLWLLARRVSRSSQPAILGIVILISSKTFIDYSASGLENPLTHLLLVLFVAVFFSEIQAERKLFWLSMIAALGMTNRLDTALIYMPPLLFTFLKNRGWRNLWRVLLGFTPFLIWELFAIIYYGFPFPNTYYAKLHAGIPFSEIFEQGVLYYVDSLSLDPLTLLVIAASFLLLIAARKWNQLPVAAGIALYLLYIVYIGGDFMSGRFFAAPLVVAVMLISRHDFESMKFSVWIPVGIVLLLTLINPRSPLLTDRSYGTKGEREWTASGIADERAFYYQTAGLLIRKRHQPAEESGYGYQAGALTAGQPAIRVIGAVGRPGYREGPGTYIVDEMGLTEPLLARLPATPTKDWRVGHYSRRLPVGYFETLESGQNKLCDTMLAKYYDVLVSITRGPIWSWDRLKNIIKMNFGLYDDLLVNVRSFDVLAVSYSDVMQVKSEGTEWNAAGNIVLTETGMSVRLDSVCHHETLEISADHNDVYRLSFRLRGVEVFKTAIRGAGGTGGTGGTGGHGLRVYSVSIPPEAAGSGYDEILVEPDLGDQLYSVGHLLLHERGVE